MVFSRLTQPARRRSVALACAASAILLLGGCGAEDLAARTSSGGTRPAVSTSASTASSCESAGPHKKHVALGFACQTCHPCDDDYGFGSLAFPGGTSTTGGTMTRSSTGVTCSVGCHSPFGAALQPVAWNAGPLQCTACHVGVPTGGAVSSHSDGATTDCTACHDQSRHTSGEVRLVTGNGESVSASCVECHSGQGQTLAGRTPPLLVGWTDAVNGDFHGARGGSGFGGTLAAPYARSQGPLACEDCHGAHTSDNAFLLAAVVNGTVIPPGSIDRAGVGAEALCGACHQGDRHEACKSCHRAGIVEDWEGFRWFDPSTPAVDPAPEGSACFLCHGHEGIQYMADFFPETPPPETFRNPDHTWLGGFWHGPAAPGIATERYSFVPTAFDQPRFPRQPNPPVFLYPGGTLFNVTETSASIYWESAAVAGTSYVEYGVGTAGYVVGATPFSYISNDPSDPTRAGWIHRVDLTGLTPNTTYVWRIRSSDKYRNVTEGPLQTFSTVNPNGPPAPVLVDEPDQYDSGGSGNDPTVYWTASQPLQWNPVTTPSGNPVQYRMQLGTDLSFASVAADTGWTAATSYPLELSGNIASCTRWYWRVMAKDTVTGEQSIWSLDTYSVCVGDPYNDY